MLIQRFCHSSQRLPQREVLQWLRVPWWDIPNLSECLCLGGPGRTIFRTAWWNSFVAVIESISWDTTDTTPIQLWLCKPLVSGTAPQSTSRYRFVSLKGRRVHEGSKGVWFLQGWCKVYLHSWLRLGFGFKAMSKWTIHKMTIASSVCVCV